MAIGVGRYFRVGCRGSPEKLWMEIQELMMQKHIQGCFVPCPQKILEDLSLNSAIWGHFVLCKLKSDFYMSFLHSEKLIMDWICLYRIQSNHPREFLQKAHMTCSALKVNLCWQCDMNEIYLFCCITFLKFQLNLNNIYCTTELSWLIHSFIHIFAYGYLYLVCISVQKQVG